MLSERIHTLRRKSGLSQEQLAEKLGVSRQAISKWESGTSTPELDKLILLSECFHVTLDELVHGPADTDEIPAVAPKTASRMHRTVGIILGTVGLLCLIAALCIAVSDTPAAETVQRSITVEFNGGGLLALAGVLISAFGVFLILKKK